MEIQILSLIVALLAVIVGPIVTYKITKRNLEFQFRTIVKEQWVNKLEESAHSFLHFTLEWIEKYRGLIDNTLHYNDPYKEIDRLFTGINSSVIKMQLLLDNEKPEQKNILDSIIKMKAIVNSKSFDDSSIDELKNNYELIIQGLKKIFQKERTKLASVFR